MLPLADGALFAAVGLVLCLLRPLALNRLNRGAAVGIFSFLSVLSVATMFHPKLHIAAAAALSAGVAAQSARLTRRYPERVDPAMRRSLVWMAGWIGMVSGGAYLRRAIIDQRALARIPRGAKGRPNVLLIVLDTVRAANLSVYGYRRPTTPFLEDIARESIVFERAVSTAPWTLPSHASMFTGRYPHELSASYIVPLDDSQPTIAEVLSAAGYLTAGFVANTMYCGRKFGLDRGFAHYEDCRPSIGEPAAHLAMARLLLSSERLRHAVGYYQNPGRRHGEQIVARFLKWRSGCDDRPYFAFLNFYDAHDPYLPPAPFDRKFAGGDPTIQSLEFPLRNVSEDAIQTSLAAYDGAIAYLDEQLRLLLKELERRGELENTVVIVTSDHGEEFGEHRCVGHGQSLYFPSVHVPLMIRPPAAQRAAVRVSNSVSLRDLAATILEFADVGDETEIPGRSWSHLWADGSAARSAEISPLFSEVAYAMGQPDWTPISRGDIQSLLLGDWRYIRNGDGREELYRLSDDPWEQHNVSGEAASTLKQFRARVNALLAQTPQRGSANLTARQEQRHQLAAMFANS
jgi:arylsulfatase A-like enzyme